MYYAFAIVKCIYNYPVLTSTQLFGVRGDFESRTE